MLYWRGSPLCCYLGWVSTTSGERDRSPTPIYIAPPLPRSVNQEALAAASQCPPEWVAVGSGHLCISSPFLCPSSPKLDVRLQMETLPMYVTYLNIRKERQLQHTASPSMWCKGIGNSYFISKCVCVCLSPPKKIHTQRKPALGCCRLRRSSCRPEPGALALPSGRQHFCCTHAING